jgi:hypothetical protein
VIYTRSLFSGLVNPGTQTLYTAPAAPEVVVIRDIQIGASGVIAPAQIVIYVGVVIEPLWAFSFPSAPPSGGASSDHWEGRQVLPPTWDLIAGVSGTFIPAWVSVTGYVFTS